MLGSKKRDCTANDSKFVIFQNSVRSFLDHCVCELSNAAAAAAAVSVRGFCPVYANLFWLCRLSLSLDVRCQMLP